MKEASDQIPPFTRFDWRPLLLSDLTRERSGLLSEFFQRTWNGLFPPALDDIHLYRLLKYDSQTFDRIWAQNVQGEEDWKLLQSRLKEDAAAAITSLEILIDAEQESPEMRRRIAQLEKSPVRFTLFHTDLDDEGTVGNLSQRAATLEELIRFIEGSYSEFGTSLKLAYRVTTVKYYLDALLDCLVLIKGIESKAATKSLLDTLIGKHKTKLRPFQFIRQRTHLVLYEIVSINSQSGTSYLAQTVKEYRSLFRSGLIGGGFIALFALIKVQIDFVGPPSLLLGFFYALNYSICFILVDALGGTIATKQPAMTANLLGNELDQSDKSRKAVSKSAAKIVAKVARSQFVSLLGNVTMAIVFSLLVSYLLNPSDYFGQEMGAKLVLKNDVNNWTTIFYAGIAGVFLSISGFIAGYIQNFVVYTRLTERYALAFPSRGKRIKLLHWLKKKAGKVSGSIALGFFLGFSGLLGEGLGVVFDIRHVAFSSSQLSYGAQWSAELFSLFPSILLSIAVIGFANFIVSFGLTFIVALRARGLGWQDLRGTFWESTKLLIRRPWMFFFPFESSDNPSDKKKAVRD